VPQEAKQKFVLDAGSVPARDGTKATGTLARPHVLLLKGSYFFFLPPFFFPPFFLVAIVLFSLFHFHGMCGLSKKPQLMNV